MKRERRRKLSEYIELEDEMENIFLYSSSFQSFMHVYMYIESKEAKKGNRRKGSLIL